MGHLTADSTAAAMHCSALVLPLALMMEIATPVPVERINGVMSIGEEVNSGGGALNSYEQFNNVFIPKTYHLTSLTARHNLVKRSPLVPFPFPLGKKKKKKPLKKLPKKFKLLKLLKKKSKKKGPLGFKKSKKGFKKSQPLLLKKGGKKLKKGVKKSKPVIKKGVKGAAAVSAPIALSGIGIPGLGIGAPALGIAGIPELTVIINLLKSILAPLPVPLPLVFQDY